MEAQPVALLAKSHAQEIAQNKRMGKKYIVHLPLCCTGCADLNIVCDWIGILTCVGIFSVILLDTDGTDDYCGPGNVDNPCARCHQC